MAKEIPSLILKSGRERSIIRRHPWVFSGAVKNSPKAPSGSIIAIRDNKHELLGYGHFDGQSQIVCRMFAFGPEEIEFTSEYWQNKLQQAYTYRKNILDLEKNTGFRLLNAEGDNLPGIVIDVFGEAVSVQLRTGGAKNLKPEIDTFLDGFKELKYRYYSIATQEKKGKNEGWEGNSPEEEKSELPQIKFAENDLKFYADISGGQKTGFFLDQRENRKLVREYSQGKDVLDMFSYSGGFSSNALFGGAKSVKSVDVSASANELCRQNVALNKLEKGNHEAITADAFQFLREMEPNQYDLIVLDPPAFTKHISTVKKAARGYKEINLKAMQKIRPGSLLFTFSCSQHITPDLFRKIIFGAAADAGREISIITQMTQANCHPINIFHPEGEYLKGLMLYVH